MNLTEARLTIRDEKADFFQRTFAAGVLTSERESSFEDLLACLRWKGLPAEMGAIALYTRTKRPREDKTFHSIVTDAEDWTLYLLEKKLMSNSTPNR